MLEDLTFSEYAFEIFLYPWDEHGDMGRKERN